jgi:predicted naringenin-chalcone synthase
MFITGLGTAVPSNQYTQRECWQALQVSDPFTRLAPRSQAILRKVLNADNGIETRHLVFDQLTEAFAMDPDTLQQRFTRHAPALAAQAVQRALDEAKLAISEVDALIISTCTGYLCPGLTSYVAERLGLRPNVLCLDLVGQGCGAALPNLRTAAAVIAAGGAKNIVSVCVEVCSAAMYLDDDPGVLISACLFGDGAAAAAVSARPREHRPIQWRDAETVLKPGLRDELRFEHRGGMLRNVLLPSVPGLAATAAEEVLSTVLARVGRSRDEIRAWLWHAGGRDVLTALKQRLGLSAEDVRHSADVLRVNGNISSPCVLFVLDATLRAGAPAGLWWMSSFGAGFSCHGALLDVE